MCWQYGHPDGGMSEKIKPIRRLKGSRKISYGSATPPVEEVSKGVSH